MSIIKNILFTAACLFLFVLYAATLFVLAAVLFVGGFVVSLFTNER